MRIERSIPGRPREILIILIGYVRPILRGVLLGEPKINDIDPARILPCADQKIIGLHIPMYEHFAVNILQPLEHLVGHQQHRLEIELAVALREDIFEGGAEQIHHHKIVLALRGTQEIVGEAVVYRLVVV